VATLIVLYAARIAVRTARIAVDGLEDAQRTRHAQLLLDLSRRWDEEAVIESVKLSSMHSVEGVTELLERLYADQPDRLDDSERQRRSEDLDLYAKLFIWPNLLETIGGLYSAGAISAEVVYKMWGAEVVSAWDTWEKSVYRLRELEKDAGTYRNFQELAERMTPLHAAGKAAPLPEG
jgi:hypothetical protein